MRWMAAALCLLAASGCGRGTTLVYDVRVTDSLPRQILVDLKLDRLPAGTPLTLRSYASPEDSRFDQMSAADDVGAPLPLTVRTSNGDDGARYTFVAPRSGRARVRYRVVPSEHAMDANMSSPPPRKIAVDDRFAFLRGRDLFLFPDRPEAVGSARVAFSLPTSWQAWSSWMRDGLRGATSWVRGRAALERMLVSPIGLGIFQVRRLEHESTSYRFLFESSIPSADQARIGTELESASRAVASTIGRRIEPRYAAFVLPRTSRGEEIWGDASGHGQGATLAPLTTERFRQFARRLLDARLQDPPRAVVFQDPADRWFPLGVREYLSLEVVAAIREIPAETVDRYLGHEYGMLPVDQLQALDLEHAFLAEAGDRTNRQALGSVAPLAVRTLERDLGGSERFDAWLSRLMRRNAIASIWDEMPLAPAHRARFREAWVRGRGRLPMEFAEEVSEIRPAPNAARAPHGSAAASLRIAITAQTLGYLENCGCKLSQSGGLARRSAILRKLRSGSTPLLALDVGSALTELQLGGQLDPFASAEQRAYLEIVAGMGYAAMTPGRTDLGHGLAAFDALRSGLPLPYTVANVHRRNGASFLPEVRTVTAGSVRCRMIGVTTSMNPFYRPSVLEEAVDSLEFQDPVAAVARVTATLPSSDFVVVSGEIPYRAIRDIAKRCPQVDIIVASPQMYFGELAPKNPTGSRQQDFPGFLGHTLVAYGDLGSYGVSGVLIDLAADGRIAGAAFEHYELNETVPDDPVVRSKLDRFYASLAPSAVVAAHVESPASRWAGSKSRWVGTAACAECHEAETDQWRGTSHASAMRTLIRVHRDAQPRCVSCHVVGFGTTGGYRVGAKTLHLAGVQCENCHGPGSAHVADPRAANIVKRVPESVCVSCHTPEHSEAFVYTDRIPKVTHGSGAARLARAP